MAVKVSFIGLGTMGKPMAENIARAGFELMVYDVRPDPLEELASLGAKVARSPRESAEHGGVVALAVVDDAQVEEVLTGKEGALDGARPGTTIVIHSTVLPGTVLKMAERAQAQGVGLLDAPVSGGEAGARERKLCYMVGGDPGLLEKCRPVFAASAGTILHMGELGRGVTAKIISQLVVCINMLAAAEAELLCEKAGLDFKLLQRVLRASSGQSFAIDHWPERFKRPSDPDSIRKHRTEVFSKSLSPALELAHDLGVSLPGAALAHRLLPRIMGLENTNR